MSIIIQFGPTHLSSSVVPPAPACIVEAETTLDMGPALEHEQNIPITEDDSSEVSVTAPVTLSHHNVKEKRSNHSSHCGYSSCFGLPYQDHNYGAPPPPTPPQSPTSKVNGTTDDDTNFSVISTTSTNNEEEAQEQSVTRCICGFNHDDEYMICCDKCSVWQHVDCMGLDRTNMPETYMCEKCEPRKVDRHKAKALQTRKKEEMTEDSTSEESGEDESSVNHIQNHLNETNIVKNKRIKKRRKDKKTEVKIEYSPTKRIKNSKANKEKNEVRKPRLRNRSKSKSEGTGAPDEEAQDAWESNLNDWIDKYEEADINQYTPEIELWTSTLKMNGQSGDYLKKHSIKLQDQLCKVVEFSSNQKGLVANQDMLQDQAIIEYRGKFLSFSQFCEQNPVFNKRSFPYVLFYKTQNDQNMCVDAREYGNDARFIRRSCTPNAVVHHTLENGILHLYLFSSESIKKNQEITIPFDFCYNECIRDVECACENANCPVSGLHKNHNMSNEKKRRGGKKVLNILDDDSSQSSVPNSSIVMSPTKSSKVVSPMKNTFNGHQVNSTNALSSSPAVLADSTTDIKVLNDEQDFDEQSAASKKKMTREERKIDAIMKAFERMEKTAKRRQLALERMAQQRAQKNSTDDSHEMQIEHPDPIQQQTKEHQQSSETHEMEDVQEIHVTEEVPEHEELEHQNQVNEGTEKEHKPRLLVSSDQSSEKCVENTILVTDDEKHCYSLPTLEVVCEDIRHTLHASTPQIYRHKKGKRRRGSGTPSRRRMRTNSGGSDILSPDEMVVANASITMGPLPLASLTSASLANSPVACQNITSPGASAVPKTKRFLMHEWLQKSETSVPVSTPLSIHTELTWDLSTASPTCYVRCTKDSPQVGGISSAHLRRSSTSSSQGGKLSSSLGSAKKRWLRQAMFESGTSELECSYSASGNINIMDTGLCSPPHNGSISPISQSDLSSPCITPPGDAITPLKKRRLMRESLESLPSRSPSPISDWHATVTSVASPEHSNSVMDENDLPATMEENLSNLDESKAQDVTKPSSSGLNGLRSHLVSSAAEMDENWLTKTSKSDMVPSISSSADEPARPVPNRFNSESCVSGGCSTNIKICESVLNKNTVQSTSPETSQDSLCLDLSCRISPDSGAPSNICKSEPVQDADNSVSTLGEKTNKEVSDTSVCDSDCGSTLISKKDISSTFNICKEDTKELDRTGDIHVPCSMKDDLGQEPSSTSDFISSSSSVNNAASSSHPLSQTHVSSSLCPPCDDSLNIHTTSLPGAGLVSSSSSAAGGTSVCLSKKPDDILSKNNVQNDSFQATLHAATVSSSIGINQECKAPLQDTHSAQSPKPSANSSIVNNITGTLALSVSSTTCVSSTGQKRKMSLSEYRMRMRENSGNANSSTTTSTNTCSNASSILTESKADNKRPCGTNGKSEASDITVKLSPLPLFEPLITVEQPKAPKVSEVVKTEIPSRKHEKQVNNTYKIEKPIEHRERLSQRLKREFGLGDDICDDIERLRTNNGQNTSLLKAKHNSPLLTLCAQPPPPPPPATGCSTPTKASNPSNTNQYGYQQASQSYTQQPYMVSQVPAPYISSSPLQQAQPQGSVPVIHHPSSHIQQAPNSSHTVCSIVQSPTRVLQVSPHSHPYASPTGAPSLLHSPVPRPPHSGYSNVTNSQNFVTPPPPPPLPPPPPPPPTQQQNYHYNQGMFK